MSIDWIITWPKKKDLDPELVDFFKPPTAEVIGEVIEDYLGGLLEELEYKDKNFWIATLKGTKSYMFSRHGGRERPWEAGEPRWFEVWIRKNDITITTRMTDDITNGIAADFARRCAQRWNGVLDQPS